MLADWEREWNPAEKVVQFEMGTPIAPIAYTEDCKLSCDYA